MVVKCKIFAILSAINITIYANDYEKIFENKYISKKHPVIVTKTENGRDIGKKSHWNMVISQNIPIEYGLSWKPINDQKLYYHIKNKYKINDFKWIVFNTEGNIISIGNDYPDYEKITDILSKSNLINIKKHLESQIKNFPDNFSIKSRYLIFLKNESHRKSARSLPLSAFKLVKEGIDPEKIKIDWSEAEDARIWEETALELNQIFKYDQYLAIQPENIKIIEEDSIKEESKSNLIKSLYTKYTPLFESNLFNNTSNAIAWKYLIHSLKTTGRESKLKQLFNDDFIEILQNTSSPIEISSDLIKISKDNSNISIVILKNAWGKAYKPWINLPGIPQKAKYKAWDYTWREIGEPLIKLAINNDPELATEIFKEIYNNSPILPQVNAAIETAKSLNNHELAAKWSSITNEYNKITNTNPSTPILYLKSNNSTIANDKTNKLEELISDRNLLFFYDLNGKLYPQTPETNKYKKDFSHIFQKISQDGLYLINKDLNFQKLSDLFLDLQQIEGQLNALGFRNKLELLQNLSNKYPENIDLMEKLALNYREKALKTISNKDFDEEKEEEIGNYIRIIDKIFKSNLWKRWGHRYEQNAYFPSDPAFRKIESIKSKSNHWNEIITDELNKNINNERIWSMWIDIQSIRNDDIPHNLFQTINIINQDPIFEKDWFINKYITILDSMGENNKIENYLKKIYYKKTFNGISPKNSEKQQNLEFIQKMIIKSLIKQNKTIEAKNFADMVGISIKKSSNQSQ